MARLIFSTIVSLDGFVEAADGDFAWAEPDAEVHAFVNDRERPIGTYLYGRRMYETMAVWETDPTLGEGSDVMREYAELWREADKVVYSTTLPAPVTTRTRIEKTLDPRAVASMKTAADRDLAVAGPTLAAHAFRAGLVDAFRLYVQPISLGRGKRALPDDLRLELDLVEQRSFRSGVVFLEYRVLGRKGITSNDGTSALTIDVVCGQIDTRRTPVR